MDERVKALAERALESAGPDDDAAFRKWIDAFLAGTVGERQTASAWIRANGFEAGVRAACGDDLLATRAHARGAVLAAALAKPDELDKAIADATAALDALEEAGGTDEPPFKDPEAVAFDRLLDEIQARLGKWTKGEGPAAAAALDARASAILGRTAARIVEARMKLREEAEKDAEKSPMPTKTSIRDLLTFVVDQLHRYDDALAVKRDQALRTAFADTVAKDVVYRVLAPYLATAFGVSIDMSVVVGADTSLLSGLFKLDGSGPKPKRRTTTIYSVVVPALMQGGTCIRPATVRIGELEEKGP